MIVMANLVFFPRHILLRHTNIGFTGPSAQLALPSHALFGLRQMSYKAQSSLLLGADFSSVGRIS